MTGKELLEKLSMIHDTNPDLLELQMFSMYDVYPRRVIKGTNSPRLGKMSIKYTSNQFGVQVISPEKAIQLSDVPGFDSSKIDMQVDEGVEAKNANVLLI